MIQELWINYARTANMHVLRLQIHILIDAY